MNTQITVDYTGWLTNGAQFDTATAARFPLGGVIFGFVDGIFNMSVGGDRIIVIPSDLAYGAQNRNGINGQAAIPPNSTLIFRIKLKAITSGI